MLPKLKMMMPPLAVQWLFLRGQTGPPQESRVAHTHPKGGAATAGYGFVWGDPAHLDKLDPQKDLRNKVLSTRQKRLFIDQVVLNLHNVAFANVTSGNAPKALFLFKPNHLSYLVFLGKRAAVAPSSGEDSPTDSSPPPLPTDRAHTTLLGTARPPPRPPPMWYGWCTSKSRMHPPVIRPPPPLPRGRRWDFFLGSAILRFSSSSSSFLREPCESDVLPGFLFLRSKEEG